ncbi:Predicted PurR-regulated permease PerM [Pedobacter xixiisoli]|uniref:Predicted PurR-regulated permease PerM n=2 Tax=Pedobacter xixiisoli TaxID=1476464 RepID=A0A285ZZU8_9SPHI|nr:Predicted PurR-regulated permease PerM [Pedobacter xixiisoli]
MLGLDNFISMTENRSFSLYRTLTASILYLFGLVVLLWFLYKTISVVILFLFAIILGIIINQPVNKLEKRGMKRWLAALLVLGAIFIVTSVIGILVVPVISDQIDILIGNIPSYINSITSHLEHLLRKYPELSKNIPKEQVSLGSAMPSLGKTVMGLGSFSFSILGGLFVFIVFISMIVFFVGNPRPIIQLYLSAFLPDKREKATNALKHTSTMLGGWMKSNLIGGIIQAVLVFVFLSIFGVPGALVWAALAFFSELIPKIGFYIMAIPPTLVALSISPATALWCLVFFLILNEVTADFLMPKLRSKTMNIHPVSLLFLLLSMGAAFGIMGALLATPMAAIIKAYYEEFYLARFPEDHQIENNIDEILYGNDK